MIQGAELLEKKKTDDWSIGMKSDDKCLNSFKLPADRHPTFLHVFSDDWQASLFRWYLVTNKCIFRHIRS